jgi:16S rRNA processing protein RimM
MVAISDDPHRFDEGSLLIRNDGSPLVVEGSRPHRGNRLLLKFEGVDSRDAAERLRGPVYVAVEERRSLEEGEYWRDDLIGCRVVTPSGGDIGVVGEVIEGPVQDLLSVDLDDRNILVPLVKEIVVAVDLQARRVTIDPPAGLVD